MAFPATPCPVGAASARFPNHALSCMLMQSDRLATFETVVTPLYTG